MYNLPSGFGHESAYKQLEGARARADVDSFVLLHVGMVLALDYTVWHQLAQSQPKCDLPLKVTSTACVPVTPTS